MAKQIAIRCPAPVAQIIIDALKWFIERNYPAGTDECSIAARDALYDLVGRFEQELLPLGETAYSIRMRAFLCEAVRSYLLVQAHQSGACHEHRCRVIVDVCRGHSDAADFADAAARDAAVPAAPGSAGEAP